MSIHISVESIQGKQRKEIIEEIQQKAKEAALQASKSVIEAGLEAEVDKQRGREKEERRRVCGQPHQSEWKCGYCGCQDANHFTRDGYYNRGNPGAWVNRASS